MDVRQVGAALREVREMARLKQVDVAERLGVSDGAVSQWESGRELKPSQLQAFAELVDLDFDALLFKLGYPVSEEAREHYTRWLLARYAQPGALVRAPINPDTAPGGNSDRAQLTMSTSRPDHRSTSGILGQFAYQTA